MPTCCQYSASGSDYWCMSPSASAYGSYMAAALVGKNTWLSIGAAVPGELLLAAGAASAAAAVTAVDANAGRNSNAGATCLTAWITTSQSLWLAMRQLPCLASLPCRVGVVGWAQNLHTRLRCMVQPATARMPAW
jgi:hypothetical protein